MLVLTRKVGEAIAIGDDIKVIVMQVKGKQVRLGIKAGPETVVHREEIYQRIQEENREASGAESLHLDEAGKLLKGNQVDPGSAPVRRFVKPSKSQS